MKKNLILLVLFSSFLWANWSPWDKDIDENNQVSIATVFLNKKNDIEIGLLLSEDEEMGLLLIYKNLGNPKFKEEELTVEYKIDQNKPLKLATYIIDNQIVASDFFDSNFSTLLGQMEKGKTLKITIPNGKGVDIPLKKFTENYKLLK